MNHVGVTTVRNAATGKDLPDRAFRPSPLAPRPRSQRSHPTRPRLSFHSGNSVARAGDRRRNALDPRSTVTRSSHPPGVAKVRPGPGPPHGTDCSASSVAALPVKTIFRTKGVETLGSIRDRPAIHKNLTTLLEGGL